MSDYLRRLVAATQSEGARVRPRVGSIYSTASSSTAAAGDGRVPVWGEETVLEQPFRRSGEESRADRSFMPQAGARGAEDQANFRSGAQVLRRDADPDASFRPLQLRSSDSGFRQATDADDPSSRSSTDRAANTQAGTVGERRSDPGDRSATIRFGEAGDSVAETSDRATAVEAVSLVKAIEGLRQQPFPALMGRTARPGPELAAAPRAPVKMAETHDQIEIHIGRIEVTAVAPPAQARPVARATRKSVNLGDYLNRGNGRG